MEKFDYSPIIPSGRLSLPSVTRRPPHYSTPRSEAAAHAEKNNTVSYLRENLFPNSFLFRKNIPDGGTVETFIPTSPFGYGSVMIVASDETLFTNEESLKQVPTSTIFDLSSQMQSEYFRQILGSLRAATATPIADDSYHAGIPNAVVVENSMVDVNNRKRRMGRSIALPHAHVIKNGHWVSPEVIPTNRSVRMEEWYLSRPERYPSFEAFFQKAGEQEIPDIIGSISFQQRGVLPLGYSLKTSFTSEDLFEEHSDAVTQLLQWNHHTYTSFVEKEIELFDEQRLEHGEKWGDRFVEPPTVKTVLKPQPSYRLYMFYTADGLQITISPSILASGGVLEACGLLVDRGPDNESFFSQTQLDEYYAQFSDFYSRIIS